MRKYEKIISKPAELNILLETSCDLCGAIAKGGDWDASTYDVNEVEVEVTVRQKNGVSYPDMGWGTELVVDMCPKCFKDTLIPFLREKGANIEEINWEF